jgi:uncharacterized protein (DUF1501 family)
MLTRRFFLRGSAIAVAGMGAVPSWMVRATAAEGKRRKTLVVVFQRGAADGLNIVIPFGEQAYAKLRPNLRIGMPTGVNAANNGQPIDLDGRFALHGAMQPFKDLWDKKQLAIVEATGSPDSSRSHFQAQDYMESGTTSQTMGDGWLNRALAEAGGNAAPLQAVSMGSQVAPQTGTPNNVATEAATIVETMYNTTVDPQWGRAGKGAFEAMKLLRSINSTNNNAPPAQQQLYSQGGNFGRSMQQLARLIKADAGVEAAFVEITGWDHHSNENQQLQNILRQMSSGLAGFSQDMGDRMEDIVVVTMSEFGRTAAENGNAGTDHGHGNLMFVLGGAVEGGKIHGQWPGLEKEQLFQGRDLDVTTDYRAVLGELVRGHLGHQDLGPVFPGFTPGDPMGLLKA